MDFLAVQTLHCNVSAKSDFGGKCDGGDVAVQRLYKFIKFVVVERSRNALCLLGICWVETRLIASLRNSFGFWSLSAAEMLFVRTGFSGLKDGQDYCNLENPKIP